MTLPRGYWTSRRPPLRRRIANWWWDRRWQRRWERDWDRKVAECQSVRCPPVQEVEVVEDA